MRLRKSPATSCAQLLLSCCQFFDACDLVVQPGGVKPDRELVSTLGHTENTLLDVHPAIVTVVAIFPFVPFRCVTAYKKVNASMPSRAQVSAVSFLSQSMYAVFLSLTATAARSQGWWCTDAQRIHPC